MSHLELQAQSLCFTPHLPQSQYVHQIHLKWFHSKTIRQMHQMKICVWLTLVTQPEPGGACQWAVRPILRSG